MLHSSSEFCRQDKCVCVQMEVGIEDCLHIEFEYDKGRYHLKDTVVGKIYFLLVSVSPNHFCCTLKPGNLAAVGASDHGMDGRYRYW